jgi:hypothetical protein
MTSSEFGEKCVGFGGHSHSDLMSLRIPTMKTRLRLWALRSHGRSASSAVAAAMAKAPKYLTAARGKLRRVSDDDDDTADMTFSFADNELGRGQTGSLPG